MGEQVAMNMREIADKANEERQQQAKMAAEQWVDAVAFPAIKQAAERGEYHFDICVPANVHKGYVDHRLVDCGFVIEQFGTKYSRYLRVKW
jgi:hypothetical protein